MSFTCHQLFINSPPRFTLYITTSLPKNPTLLSLPITSRPHFSISNHSLPNPHNSTSLSSHHSRLRVYESDGTLQSNNVVNGAFNLDYFLSVAEFLCLASSALVSVGFALNCAVLSLKKTALVAMGSSVLASGAVALVMAVGIGAWIRMRQWRRICRESVKGGLEVNLFERIEKLEEDLRSSATIIRVLSRQLEKLGIRFRVTRKALKEPIAETAALAQKNSEATRALAVQEDNLEKELGEIQKVLLAMQEPVSNEAQMHGNDDSLPCSDAVVPPTTASQNPTPVEPSTEKRKSFKKESDVWEHFEKYDVVLELKGVDGTKRKDIEKRAKCKYCSASYASDTRKNGTSSMWKHLNKQCLQYPFRHKDNSKRTLAFDASKGNALVSKKFNKDDCLDACIRMVVRDELPFSFVESEGFREFCSVACPQFNPPSRRTLGRRFLEMYTKMKEKLKVDLRSHRICLTTDTWTSVQNVNYMVLTAHFVDSDYKMHKRILNFCVIDSHKWESIGKLLENCLIDWGHEKILTITADNAAANTKAIEYVRKKINGWKDSNSVLGGVHMHMRCSAHIINLIVKEGLKRLESSIVAIRNAVKFVRSSPSRLSYFKMCVETEKIECKGLVVMDVPTRWNSTYLMLDAALKFRKAFDRMGDDPDSSYLMYFKEDEGDDEGIEGIEGSGKGKGKCKTNKRVGPPSDEDWEKAVTFVMFLKTFYDVTLKISASLHPTSHSTFHDLLAIDGEIRELYRYDVTIPIEERTAMDTLLNNMATSMKKKYDKYWGEIHKVNPFLMIGVVIDPRFKLRNLKHIFEEIFENDPTCERLVAQKTNEVKQLLMNMYEVYKPSSSNMGATSTTNESGGSTNNETDSSSVFGGRKRKTMMEKWKKIQQESENVVITHEVDRYLLDPLESIDEEFDILGWWRINGLKYPTLASIAKDVLAIPTSTIASESCFSTSGRVIDSFRSSLSPRMVEALICSQNWIRSEDISSLQYVPTIEEMEFYESIEMEIGSKTSTTNLNKTLPS